MVNEFVCVGMSVGINVDSCIVYKQKLLAVIHCSYYFDDAKSAPFLAIIFLWPLYQIITHLVA